MRLFYCVSVIIKNSFDLSVFIFPKSGVKNIYLDSFAGSTTPWRLRSNTPFRGRQWRTLVYSYRCNTVHLNATNVFFILEMKYVFWNKTKQISILPLSLYGNKVSGVKYIWGLYSESNSNLIFQILIRGQSTMFSLEELLYKERASSFP